MLDLTKEYYQIEFIKDRYPTDWFTPLGPGKNKFHFLLLLPFDTETSNNM